MRGHERRSVALTFCSRLGPNYLLMHLSLERVIRHASPGGGRRAGLRVRSETKMALARKEPRLSGELRGPALARLVLRVALNPTR